MIEVTVVACVAVVALIVALALVLHHQRVELAQAREERHTLILQLMSRNATEYAVAASRENGTHERRISEMVEPVGM